jgi:hypothetical protein
VVIEVLLGLWPGRLYALIGERSPGATHQTGRRKPVKKIITTLTAVTFALGLAAAAQAQVAKTPEKPVVQSTQEVQTQVAPKETAKPGEPVAQETVKPGDKTKEAAKTGDKDKTKPEAKQVTKKAETKCPPEKKAGANLEKTQEGTK